MDYSQLISEGYELVEDQFDLTPAVFTSQSQVLTTKIDEALDDILTPSRMKSKMSLNNVLGVIDGPYFVPGATSRNKKHYTKQLWKNCLANESVVTRLNSGLMLGTLLHPREKQDEHPRLASHVTKKLWCNEDYSMGFGKSYVLSGLPVGSIVHAFGSACDEEGKPLTQLFTSSRAWAKPTNEEIKGGKVLDPNKYILEAFDVVFSPGFLEAHPTYQQAVNEAYDLYSTKEFTGYSKVHESLESKITEDSMTIEELQKENEELKKLNGQLSAVMEDYKGRITTYEGLGTPEECTIAMTMAKESLDQYIVLGSPTKIQESLEELTSISESLDELGSLEQVREALQTSKSVIQMYRVLGTPVELQEVQESYNAYRDYGTAEEVGAALTLAHKQVVQRTTESFAKQYNFKIETVAKIMEENDNDSDKTKSFLTLMNESKEDKGFKVVNEDHTTTRKSSMSAGFITNMAKRLA